jgi:PII-like signaling protein
MSVSAQPPNPAHGFQLTFFTQQDHRHNGKPVGEWILEHARTMGIGGATLVTGNEGFGHHRRLHRIHLIDVREQPVEVIMAVTPEEADRMFALLRKERIRVFYSKTPVEFGTLGEEL